VNPTTAHASSSCINTRNSACVVVLYQHPPQQRTSSSCINTRNSACVVVLYQHPQQRSCSAATALYLGLHGLHDTYIQFDNHGWTISARKHGQLVEQTMALRS
jgi:hypothetical protein